MHQRNVELVRKLLEEGADPDRNISGRSARDYLGLMTGNTLLLREFAVADEKRSETELKSNTGRLRHERYGPDFAEMTLDELRIALAPILLLRPFLMGGMRLL